MSRDWMINAIPSQKLPKSGPSAPFLMVHRVALTATLYISVVLRRVTCRSIQWTPAPHEREKYADKERRGEFPIETCFTSSRNQKATTYLCDGDVHVRACSWIPSIPLCRPKRGHVNRRCDMMVHRSTGPASTHDRCNHELCIVNNQLPQSGRNRPYWYSVCC